MCVDCVQDAVELHVITPNSICAEPPEDGRVTPKTCRGTDS
jgi:hypothetical protein